MPRPLTPDLLDSPLPSSSPPLPSRQPRPKRPPTVTPKRFNKFFNPSSSGGASSRSSRALQDLSQSHVNRLQASHRHTPKNLSDARPAKRQRYASSDQGNDESEIAFTSSPPEAPLSQTSQYSSQELSFPKPIVRKRTSRREWNSTFQTLDFCSVPEDRHVTHPSGLPFCTAACNTNSLVAVGAEDGSVLILESAKHSKPSFDEPYVSFRPHENAVMDLTFSSDDHWLATASGDQVAKVIDMRTQVAVYVLVEHTSSLKQVAFQPGNDRILATCSRDGVIGIWDLRCAKPFPALRAEVLADASEEHYNTPNPAFPPVYKSIANGHADLLTPLPPNKHTFTMPSVTALSFLPSSPHLFVTAADSSSRLRIWDIRSRLQKARTRASGGMTTPLPVSTSATMPGHSQTRSYGITSLSLSTDAARLYAVCRDNTVHVHSTPHLILGQTPTCRKTGLEGAAPLDVLSHPSLRVGSFYVRSKVRHATSQHSEVLAVGSTDSAIVLFPIDPPRNFAAKASLNSYSLSSRAGWRGYSGKNGAAGAGTGAAALIRGHKAEVTGLAWTSEGELVSCADDYVARVWREDRDRCRSLRTGGEGGGKRWGCGWRDSDGTTAEAHLDDEEED